MNRGKLLILLMIAAGVVAGGLKIWKQHHHMDKVLENLSPEVARLIAQAPRAELLQVRLIPKSDSPLEGDHLPIEGNDFQIVARKDIASSKGFIDVRDRLVDDASYNAWKVKLDPSPKFWQYVLVFTEGDQHARLAFEFADGGIALVKLLDDGPYFIANPIADGLKSFFEAQFENQPQPKK